MITVASQNILSRPLTQRQELRGLHHSHSPCFFLLPSLPMGDGLYMLWQNGLPAGKNSRLAAVFFGLDDKDRRLREDGSLMWALMLPECKRLIVLSFFTKTLVFPNFRIHSFCMKEVTCIIF